MKNNPNKKSKIDEKNMNTCGTCKYLNRGVCIAPVPIWIINNVGEEKFDSVRLSVRIKFNNSGCPVYSKKRSENKKWNSMEDFPKGEHAQIKNWGGRVFKDAHYACDLSGEEQPPFEGFFYEDSGKTMMLKITNPIAWRKL